LQNLNEMEALKDRYFDLSALSEYSMLSVSTLRDHIRRNDLPAFKVKGKLLVRKTEFDEWIERFRYEGARDLDRIADEVIQNLKSE